MAFSDYRILEWTNPIVNEADRPKRSAAEMKAVFDSNTNQIREALNGLIGALTEPGSADQLVLSNGKNMGQAIDDLSLAISQAIVTCKAYTDSASFEAGAADMRKEVYDTRNLGLDLYTYADGIRAKTITTNLSAANWTGTGPYTQEVTVSFLTADNTAHLLAAPMLDDATETAMAQLEAWNLVGRIIPSDGKLTAICYEEAPGSDIPLRIEVLG